MLAVLTKRVFQWTPALLGRSGPAIRNGSSLATDGGNFFRQLRVDPVLAGIVTCLVGAAGFAVSSVSLMTAYIYSKYSIVVYNIIIIIGMEHS